MIKKNLFQVNGQIGRTATFVSTDDEIALDISTLHRSHSKTPKLSLEVLYEDDYLAVINKPAGILVSGNKFVTVANALSQNLSYSNQIDACRPYPIHRLDYGTTGTLLVGKTTKSIRTLSQLFADKLILKEYYAITIDEMQQLSGIIETQEELKVLSSNFEVIDTVKSHRFNMLNLLKLQPTTGKRHQLRKHMAHIGNPILGDQDYGKKGLILNGKGMYLHAFSIRLTHPITEEELNICAPIPKKFRKIFPQINEG